MSRTEGNANIVFAETVEPINRAIDMHFCWFIFRAVARFSNTNVILDSLSLL